MNHAIVWQVRPLLVAEAMHRRRLMLLLASSPLWACGPRVVEGQFDDGGQALPPAGECVVAKKRNGCCVSFTPATRKEVAADACLSAPEVTKGDEASCVLPATCIVQCPPQRPPSRAATMRDGVCVFADECRVDADCVFVENCHDCCCHDVVAEHLALRDACLFTASEDPGQCWRPCPSPCPDSTPRPGEASARCELVEVPHGMIMACVPGGPNSAP